MRKRPRPRPDRALSLAPIVHDCAECQHHTHADYKNYRTVTTLDGVTRLTLTIRRCRNPECPRFLRPYRPEAEAPPPLPPPRVRPRRHRRRRAPPLFRAPQPPRDPSGVAPPWR